MKVFFFGVRDAGRAGHHLYDSDLRYAIYPDRVFPFRISTLDSGLLPPNKGECHGELYLAVINGWTILGMWDRTGDSRFGSNASFIAEGVHTLEEMRNIATTTFPQLWARIQSVVAPHAA